MELTEMSSPTKKGVKNNTPFILKKASFAMPAMVYLLMNILTIAAARMLHL